MPKPPSISRLPPLPGPPYAPEVESLFADTRSRGGEVINLHFVMAHAPHIAKARRALAHALRYHAATPRMLRELVIIRTAQIANGHYELNQHIPMGLAAGLTQAQLDAIAEWRGSDLFDGKQRALLAYVELAASGGEVDDATYGALAGHFTPQEIVEITATIASYVGACLFTNALRVVIEDDGRRTDAGV